MPDEDAYYPYKFNPELFNFHNIPKNSLQQKLQRKMKNNLGIRTEQESNKQRVSRSLYNPTPIESGQVDHYKKLGNIGLTAAT